MTFVLAWGFATAVWYSIIRRETCSMVRLPASSEPHWLPLPPDESARGQATANAPAGASRRLPGYAGDTPTSGSGFTSD